MNNDILEIEKDFDSSSVLYYAFHSSLFDMAIKLHKDMPEKFDLNESCNNITLMEQYILRSQLHSLNILGKNEKTGSIKYIEKYFDDHFVSYDLCKETTTLKEKVALYLYKEGAKIDTNNYRALFLSMNLFSQPSHGSGQNNNFDNFLSVVFQDFGWKNIEKIKFKDEQGVEYPIIHWLNKISFTSHKNILEQMKEKGCDMDIKDSLGKSAIFYSTNSASVDFFINCGVSVFVEENSDINALEIGSYIADNNERHKVLDSLNVYIAKNFTHLMSETDSEEHSFNVIRNELINDLSLTDFKKFYKKLSIPSIDTQYQTEYGNINLLQSAILEIEDRMNKQSENNFYQRPKKIDNILTNINFLLKKGSSGFQKNILKENLIAEHSPDTYTGLVSIVANNFYYGSWTKKQESETKFLFVYLDSLIGNYPKHLSSKDTNLEHYKNSLDYLTKEIVEQSLEGFDTIEKEMVDSFFYYKILSTSSFFLNNTPEESLNEKIILLNQRISQIDNLNKKIESIEDSYSLGLSKEKRNQKQELRLIFSLDNKGQDYIHSLTSLIEKNRHNIDSKNIYQFGSSLIKISERVMSSNSLIYSQVAMPFLGLLEKIIDFSEKPTERRIDNILNFRNYIKDSYRKEKAFGSSSYRSIQSNEESQEIERLLSKIDKSIEKMSIVQATSLDQRKNRKSLSL